jgi:hypothetical protein
MTKREELRTDDPGDLEEIDVQPRRSRDVVISMRVSAEEAETIAAIAERAGVSISEFARQAVKRAASNSWRLMGAGSVNQAEFTAGPPPATGGAYGRRLDEPVGAGS